MRSLEDHLTRENAHMQMVDGLARLGFYLNVPNQALETLEFRKLPHLLAGLVPEGS